MLYGLSVVQFLQRSLGWPSISADKEGMLGVTPVLYIFVYCNTSLFISEDIGVDYICEPARNDDGNLAPRTYSISKRINVQATVLEPLCKKKRKNDVKHGPTKKFKPTKKISTNKMYINMS